MRMTSSDFCPDKDISALLAAIQGDVRQGMQRTEKLLRDYPGDARLHFLQGSLLAGEQDYAGARVAMRQAVDLAPDYHVARFQLGFLLLTSGEPHAAQEAWGPLHLLGLDNYLYLFTRGLCHLIRDEFGDTRKLLEAGIARNSENPAMNRDMQLILDNIRDKDGPPAADGQAVSSVDFLLQQSALKSKR